MKRLWAALAGMVLAFGVMTSAVLAENPTKLKIAGILSAGKEAPWETSFVSSMDRIIAAKPHGLEIEVNYTENVYDNAEQVFRTYAETGEYDILFGDTAYADAIEKLKDEFPQYHVRDVGLRQSWAWRQCLLGLRARA